MASMNIVQAVNSALDVEMGRDDDVVLMGEDVGKKGGVFGCTEGLWKKYGAERVMNSPLAESGILGTAVGMAMYGLKPVPEIQFLDFLYPGFEQVVSEAAKMRYRSGGQYTAPMVIRSPYGGGIKGGHYHSQSSEAYFCHTPGLKVVVPSNPYDTKGLLIAAIRDPDPVVFLEPKKLYRAVKGEVPEEDYTVPIGEANIAQEGTDITVLCWGAMVPVALDAAKKSAEQEVSVEVIDLRSLVPLDELTILDSVRKTGRVVIIQEAPKTCGFGAELAAIIGEKAIDYIEAPISRVCGFDIPFPYTLENLYMPDTFRVMRAISQVIKY